MLCESVGPQTGAPLGIWVGQGAVGGVGGQVMPGTEGLAGSCPALALVLQWGDPHVATN